jgi:hypothetical protein
MLQTHLHSQRPRNSQRVILVLAVVVAVAAIVFGFLHFRTPTQSTRTCSPTAVAENYISADSVVSGNVFLVVADGPENAKVLLSVDRVYKGVIPSTGITIAAKQGNGVIANPANPELHFEASATQYLLFLKKRDDGLFTTSYCYGSRELGSGLTQSEALILGAGQPAHQL